MTVKDGGRVLAEGTDYTVAYANNTAVGTATVTITGMDNYTGTRTVTFAIRAVEEEARRIGLCDANQTVSITRTSTARPSTTCSRCRRTSSSSPRTATAS